MKNTLTKAQKESSTNILYKNIRIKCGRVTEVFPKDSAPGCFKWEVTLSYLVSGEVGQREYSLTYTMGLGHQNKAGCPTPPQLTGVLWSLFSDIRIRDEYSFDNFFTDFGFKVPSEALKAWLAMEEEARELKALLQQDYSKIKEEIAQLDY